ATAAFELAEARGLAAHLCRDAGVPPWLARQLARARDRLLDVGERDRAPDALARCLLAGFPDRVAVRSGQGRQGTLVGGRGVPLPPAADGHDLLLLLRLHESGPQQRSQATVVVPLGEAELAAAHGRA